MWWCKVDLPVEEYNNRIIFRITSTVKVPVE